jgi:hypothetical protein
MEKLAGDILNDYSFPLIKKKKNLNDMPTFVMEGILRSMQERHNINIVPLDLVS